MCNVALLAEHFDYLGQSSALERLSSFSLPLSRFLPLYKEQAKLNFHGNCMHFGHGIRTGAQEGGGGGPYKANMYFAIRWQFEVDGNQRRLFVCFVQATNKQITNNKLTNRQATNPSRNWSSLRSSPRSIWRWLLISILSNWSESIGSSK